MGGLLFQADNSWGFFMALIIPVFLHTIYDYPILLAHQGLFDKDVLYIYLLLLLYLVPCLLSRCINNRHHCFDTILLTKEDSIAHHLVLDTHEEHQE